MKYVVVLGDGMADYPVEKLGGKTPLQVADKPNIDDLARRGTLGLVKTVPDHMAPGSDTANLAVLGYDPQVHYSGRSPYEAVSMNVALANNDVTFRCNLVTLSEHDTYEERLMVDHSADEISTEEARLLMADLSAQLSTEEIRFFPGVSYRHLMVWQDAPLEWQLTPPHDILGQAITQHLPRGPMGSVVAEMMKKSVQILAAHPINKERVARNLRPANSIWIWGEGKKPNLPSFFDKYKIRGGVISAVDLIKGIGTCAGLTVLEVEGATGTLHTNYRGKAEKALSALRDGLDFVYIHIEAPDECGHRQETENKVKAIELIDQMVVKRLIEGLDELGEPYKIMVLPDHATPLALRTHTVDPVPFLIFDQQHQPDRPQQRYDEANAENAAYYIGEGYTLMDIFLQSGHGEV